MELQVTQGQAPALTAQQAAPEPAQPDGRASADAAATTKDPSPDIPIPAPASPSQTGLVSKAALSDEDAAPKLDTSGVSEVQRMLKPYGISMLPEKQDAPKQNLPPEA
ncbi:hypothetical protein L0664_04330 [Octadecabacter sp. G9-8]|uniref:Uncharacterized protein n=1 Tax=Octadecabacter dasysiphoniae TaxID=2909341 RepID=A0ABS9CVT5_9RHOB|nr:hypothetical protein [Octadecabacter dasysiphoniae]MCF2870286.1 hypothetical protein [Octadecabacter dasysiphoniae]